MNDLTIVERLFDESTQDLFGGLCTISQGVNEIMKAWSIGRSCLHLQIVNDNTTIQVLDGVLNKVGIRIRCHRFSTADY